MNEGVYVAFKDSQKLSIYEGSISGVISDKVEGKNGFGWDYIFIVDGFGKTISLLEEHKHLLNFRREPYIKFSINHL